MAPAQWGYLLLGPCGPHSGPYHHVVASAGWLRGVRTSSFGRHDDHDGAGHDDHHGAGHDDHHGAGHDDRGATHDDRGATHDDHDHDASRGDLRYAHLPTAHHDKHDGQNRRSLRDTHRFAPDHSDPV
jgi:hypothetical protein